ncbi:hypothetical protein C0993_006551, partial [Termitomyces sp. T159_Od127]
MENSVSRLFDLSCVSITTSLLETIVGKARMVYTGFEEKFTVSYGVVIENWPIERFHLPSDLTRPEVDILLSTWTSKTTFFWKMEEDEWAKWRNNRAAALAS